MALLSQALHLGYLLSPHSAFQGHAAHTARWPAMLSPNGSSDTCISDGVFHIPMPCLHGALPVYPKVLLHFSIMLHGAAQAGGTQPCITALQLCDISGVSGEAASAISCNTVLSSCDNAHRGSPWKAACWTCGLLMWPSKVSAIEANPDGLKWDPMKSLSLPTSACTAARIISCISCITVL